ncbi:hypothetical protein BJ170DRAFT_599996 [Xylariales sp. AK1849]|nr:hypothetical protein BJ170DRAFT_599996 [Xylariales sp. AK1849]
MHHPARGPSHLAEGSRDSDDLHIVRWPKWEVDKIGPCAFDIVVVLSRMASASGQEAPLTEARKLVSGDLFHCVYPPGDEPKIATLSETISDSGGLTDKSRGEAAKILVDDKEVSNGVSLVSFINVPEDGWKMFSVGSRLQLPGAGLPPIITKPFDELLGLIHTFFAHPKPVLDLPVQGMGFALSRPQDASMISHTWRFRRETREILSPTRCLLGLSWKMMTNIEVRSCREIGVAWTPLIVEVNGMSRSNGAEISALFNVDGVWKIFGGQDTGLCVDGTEDAMDLGNMLHGHVQLPFHVGGCRTKI